MLVDIVHEIVSYQLQNQFPIFEATVFSFFSSFNQLVGIYNVALGERKVGQFMKNIMKGVNLKSEPLVYR